MYNHYFQTLAKGVSARTAPTLINTVHDKDTEINELVIYRRVTKNNNEIKDEVEELMNWMFGEDTHSRVSNNIDSGEEDTNT